MKTLLILLFGILISKNPIENTTWTCKVAEGCFDTLKFKNDNLVNEYSCEDNYTCHSSYSYSKNTITIITKDDSHSEDHGKIDYFKIQYAIRGNYLYPFSRSELINKKWKKVDLKFDKKYFFKKL
ncbi:MAG: hypothetical protein ABI367_05925 [Mucilaginibacter sp.]